ncbi:MAG: type I 3-dehydroquinate dehydratase [Bacteroidales bacterium]|jgi:3-dehydroquinate dehydratase-1|nr:type I 3-dehydroquinate dehydratase [Bacteroidales bacterium]
MICVTISEPDVIHLLRILKSLEFAEIRMDLMNLTEKNIALIFSQPVRLIATCHKGRFTSKKRKQMLIKAIESGATYVDIEIESHKKFKNDIISIAKANGCKVIISYHNFLQTPPLKDLHAIIRQCFSSGADIAKVACKSNSDSDAARIIGLLGEYKDLVGIGMGEKGKLTRIASLLIETPFTFAAPDEGVCTAPGQIRYTELRNIYQYLSTT